MGAERAFAETAVTTSSILSPSLADGGQPLSPLTEVPVELTVRVGRTRLTLGKLLNLEAGAVLSLEKQVGEPAEILVGEKVVALGQMVVVGEELGVRIIETAPELGHERS